MHIKQKSKSDKTLAMGKSYSYLKTRLV